MFCEPLVKIKMKIITIVHFVCVCGRVMLSCGHTYLVSSEHFVRLFSCKPYTDRSYTAEGEF